MNNLSETSLRPTVEPTKIEDLLFFARMYPHADEETPVSPPTTLGRDLSCDVTLDDASVSRHHARIERAGRDQLVLRDLDSRNGCFVNRCRVDGEHIVKPGDLIRLGEVLLRLVCRPQSMMRRADDSEGTLVGGPGLDEVRRRIRLMGATSLRILITGESGTGKELVAQGLHRHHGGGGPFIAVNCAALPEPLVEAELFGYAQGAFTGAARGKQGLFEAARGGTLFLDEVTELPLAGQAKLLRVVESGELRRVGAVSSTRTDCRILCATNRDITREIERGRFRADLAARLAEAEIQLPPLRDRLEDLPRLIEHLCRRAGCRLDLSARVLEAMASYHWPLNVRELDNVVRMLDVMAQGGPVELSMLPDHLTVSTPAPPRGDPSRIAQVLEALRRNDGNIRRTSQILNVSRSFIYRCLDRSGVSPADLREGTEDA